MEEKWPKGRSESYRIESCLSGLYNIQTEPKKEVMPASPSRFDGYVDFFFIDIWVPVSSPQRLVAIY